MSGKMMGLVWDLDLPHQQQLVLLAMADHADHEGKRIFPSIGLLAWKTGYSDRQVRRIVKDLIDSGIVVLVKSGYKNGGANLYALNLAAGKLKEPYRSRDDIDPNDYGKTSDKVTDVKMSDVTKCQMDGSKCPTTSDIAMSPDPSFNHHDPSVCVGDPGQTKPAKPQPPPKPARNQPTPPPPQPPAFLEHPAIKVYLENAGQGGAISESDAHDIITTATDLEVWSALCVRWRQNHNAFKVGNMLSRYAKDVKEKQGTLVFPAPNGKANGAAGDALERVMREVKSSGSWGNPAFPAEIQRVIDTFGGWSAVCARADDPTFRAQFRVRYGEVCYA